MLCHNSYTTLQFIFSTSIPHDGIHIKASEAFNFNKAHEWLLMDFCFEYPLSQIEILEGMTSIFAKVS